MRGVGPDPWPPASCAHLHVTGDLEVEAYGSVMSPSIIDHLETCRPDPTEYVLG